MAQVDPYDPISGITGTEGAAFRPVSLTPGTITPIAVSDAQRLYLLIFPATSDLIVAPWADVMAYGWRGSIAPGQSPILIHQASYGPLVSGDWFAVSAAGGIIRVIECRTTGLRSD